MAEVSAVSSSKDECAKRCLCIQCMLTAGEIWSTISYYRSVVLSLQVVKPAVYI